MCGKVKFFVGGQPQRTGICHCTDCRQESGSAFTYFGIWPKSAFQCEGETNAYSGRQFCPFGGSRAFAIDVDGAEIRLGSLLVAPTCMTPTYELWIKRRDPWLLPIPDAEQFEEDRPQKG